MTLAAHGPSPMRYNASTSGSIRMGAANLGRVIKGITAVKRLSSLVIVLLAFGGSFQAFGQTATEPAENSNPMEVLLFRQVPPQFTGGGQMEVVVTISAAVPGAMTAMGLYEQVPPEWTFTAMRGMTGDPPPIAPEPGSMSPLQFAWITPPPLPYTFAYTLTIPPADAGMKTISGQVEYRTTGPRLVSAPAITELNGVDKTPPTITLLGPSPMTIEVGTPYEEPGYTATDNVDGDITSRVKVMGTVDISRAGQYSLAYSVTDNAGNQSQTIMRTVIVKASNTNTNTNTGRVSTYGGGGYYGGANTRQNQANKTSQNTALAQKQNTPPKGQTPSDQQNAAEMNYPTPGPGSTPDNPMNKFKIPKLPGSKDAKDPAGKPGDAPGGGADKKAGKLEDMDAAGTLAAANTAPLAAAPPVPPGAAATTESKDPSAALKNGAPAKTPDSPGAAPAKPARPRVGLITRLRTAFGIMTPAQRVGFAASGGVALVLALLAAVAGKIAYGGKIPRRRSAAPPKNA